MSRQNLTTNACTVCRRKRTKCDGRQPCRRCVSRGEHCVYEDKMWRTKDHLRSEIERLRKEVHQCQGLIKALAIGGTAVDWSAIQSCMRRGDPPECIAAWINSARSPSGPQGAETSREQTEHQTASPWNSSQSTIPEPCGPPDTSSRPYQPAHSYAPGSTRSSPADSHVNTAPGTGSPAVSEIQSRSAAYVSSKPQTIFMADDNRPTTPGSLRSWTGMTQDTELPRHLLHHYFDNCFPDFSFICKERFMADVDKWTGMHCSSALLHAILGFASQTYESSPDSGPDYCLSSRFLTQAKELLSERNDTTSITDVQATGILALAEANVGNDEAAIELATDCVRKAVVWKIRMASGSIRTDDPGDREAVATTFCGAFSLARIFRILTGRLSCQNGPLFMRLTPDNEDSSIDSPAARVERGVTLQQQFFSELGHCSELLRFINGVTEIAHTFCSYHHDDGVTAADLVPAYGKCLQAWLPFQTWLSNGNKIDRDTLFAQIWYNYILAVLFSTLIYTKVDLRDGITPRAVVIRASEILIFLTSLYQKQFGFLAIHPLLPHMVFAATLVQMRRPFDDDIEQATTDTACSTRKRHSATLSPTAVAVDRLGNSPPNDTHPRRSPSQAVPASDLIYPPWRHHIAPATLRQAGVAGTDIDYDADATSPTAYVWPSKRASELVSEGTLHLTNMGAMNRKAAALARALRAQYSASPVPEVAIGGPLPHHTPGWAAVNWGHGGGGIGAGFCGLGVDRLQDFAAMTSHPAGAVTGPSENVAPEYMVGIGSGCLGNQSGLARRGGHPDGGSYGGLYVYPYSLPQTGSAASYGGFLPERMEDVEIASSAGQDRGTDGLP